MTPRPQWPSWVLAFGLAAVILTFVPLSVAFFVTPESLDAGSMSWIPPCPSRLAGTSCSLCGMTHAFAAMAHGRAGEAAEFNALGPGAYIGSWVAFVGGLGAIGLSAFVRRRGSAS